MQDPKQGLELTAEADEEQLSVQQWQVAAIRAGIEQADRGQGCEIEQVRRSWERNAPTPT